MQYIRPDVATICVGQAASMGAFLLAAGAKGKRRTLPHGRVMIHQPSAGMGRSQVTDIEIWAKEFQRMKVTLNERLAEMTGQPIEKLAADVERDYFMTAHEACEYGIIDEVIENKPEEEDDE
jgi:ATP-dependent Clp protease protease subunit